jgi:uncharacterized protein involved in outer membrane biogenesis
MQPAYYSSYEYNKPKPQRPERSDAATRIGGLMRQRIGRWLLYIGGGFSALVLLLMLIGWLFSDEIGRKAIQMLNSELKTECKVQSADLSFFKSFPRATVVLEQVDLKDAFGKCLLTAQEVDLSFDALSLFGNHIVLDQVTIKNGVLRLVTDVQGRSNWEILKTDKKSKASAPISLDIHNARFVEVELTVADAQVPYQFDARLHDAQVRGRFGADRFGMLSDARMTVHQLRYEGRTYLSKTPLKYQTTMTVDLVKNAWMVQNCALEIGKGNLLELSGLAAFAKHHADYNLQFAAKRGDISLLMHLLPAEYARSLNGITSSGTYHAKGTMKGRMSKTSYPKVQLQFGMQNASIAHQRLPKPLKSVHFQADLLLNPDGSGHLRVPDFRANYDGAPLAVKMSVTDFRNPFLDLNASGKLSIQAGQATGNTDFSLQSGQFDLRNLHIRGAIADLKSAAGRSRVQVAAQADVAQVLALYNKQQIRIPRAQVHIANGDAKVIQAQIAVAGSDFTLDATVQSFLPWALGNAAQPGVHFQAKIGSKKCDLAALMAVFAAPSQGKSASSQHSATAALPSADVELDIADMSYQKVQAQQVRGQIKLRDQKLVFKANAHAMQGRVAVAGCAHLDQNNRLELNAGLESVHLSPMFAQCNNFSQEVITAQNISGTMTGRVAAQVFFDAKGNLLMDKLVVYSDLLAHQGQLKNVEAFASFSKILREDDLKNLKFTTLQNYIEVRNGKVYLPAMHIQNNACNMTISGEQSFNNDLNYYIKVNAGQAMLNRLRKSQSDGEVLAANDGGLNMYYTMTGNIDNYKIALGRTAVRKAFEASTERRTSIDANLDAAFKRYKPDFEMSPLREISPAEQIVEAPVFEAEPQAEVEKPRPKPVSKPKPRLSLTQGSLFPPATKISQASDEEFLDEIVGGEK